MVRRTRLALTFYPRMKILIVDDEKAIRDAASVAIRADGHEPDTADGGRVALLKLREDFYDLVFLDLRLGGEDGLSVLREIRRAHPSLPVVVFTAHASVQTAIAAMQQAGASDYLSKPFTPEQLRHIVERADKFRAMEQRIETLENEAALAAPAAQFESGDPKVAQVYDVLFRAAQSSASLLILGESGTGKSLVARAVHGRSHLANGPFITVNCPSLSREPLGSELFGHVKGAFAGAVKGTWGKVAAARGGTLFLDEIGELPLEIQPKLLRLLQDGEYERLGESKTHTASLRMIAATNRDLAACVAAGTFREDLYYRLNVISVTMPPLRQRPDDLLRLANHFLEFFARQIGRKLDGLDDGARERLLTHNWPGNVRELRNVIERAVILGGGEKLTSADFPDDRQVNGSGGLVPGALLSIEKLERLHIERVLAITRNQEAASRILGIDPATLYRKRKKWRESGNA